MHCSIRILQIAMCSYNVKILKGALGLKLGISVGQAQVQQAIKLRRTAESNVEALKSQTKVGCFWQSIL